MAKVLPIGILILGLGLRLYQISPALLELVPNRQLIDAEIARAVYEQGFKNVGVQLFGLPLYHYLVVVIYWLLGGVNEVAGRWLSAGISVAAAMAFYKLLRLFGSQFQALAGLIFFYLLSPAHIIISRSFLVDELTLFMGIVSLYLLARKSFWAGTVMMSLTLLSKFTFGYLLLPALWFIKKKRQLFLLLTLVPVLIWSIYVKHLNEQLIGGQPTGEYNLFYVFNPKNIISIGFYINIFYHFSRYAVTFMWLPLVVMGLLWKSKQKIATPFYLWFLGAWGFILGFNIPSRTHSYYFLALVPPVAWFAAAATEGLYKSLKSRLWIPLPTIAVGLVALGLTSLVTDEFLKAYRTYDPYRRIPEVGQVIQNLTRSDDKIVATANRTEGVVYFSHRQGWELRLGAMNDNEAIDKLKSWRLTGAKYYIVYDEAELLIKPEFNQYLSRFPIIRQIDKTRVYDLRSSD